MISYLFGDDGCDDKTREQWHFMFDGKIPIAIVKRKWTRLLFMTHDVNVLLFWLAGGRIETEKQDKSINVYHVCNCVGIR